MIDLPNGANGRGSGTATAPRAARDEIVALFDVCFCVIVVLALLSNSVIGPLTPLTMMAAIAAYVVLHAKRLPQVFSTAWPLLLLPLVALASVAWSVYPGATLRYGLYYLVTVIVAVMIGSGMRGEDMLKGVFVGLLVSGVIGLAAGRFVFIGTTGELAFAGIQGSKNAAGEIAGLALLVSGAMAAFSLRQRAFGWLLTALLGILVAAVSLVLSKATGALIASVIASVCLFMWLFSRRMPLQARATIFVLAAIALTGLGLTVAYWMPPLFELVVEASGKDAGLTGRDLLWRKADDLIAARPWLGRGYNAFWVHNNLDAEYLWREMGILNRSGFNFHNTYREILVDLGYVGLAIFVSVAAISAFVLIVSTMLWPSIPLITASSLIVYFIFKLPFETFGFGGMHLLSLLAYTALAMGLSASPRRRLEPSAIAPVR